MEVEGMTKYVNKCLKAGGWKTKVARLPITFHFPVVIVLMVHILSSWTRGVPDDVRLCLNGL
jgi:hypothetical protein